jgi:hypothetical protein
MAMPPDRVKNLGNVSEKFGIAMKSSLAKIGACFLNELQECPEN